MDLPPIEVSAVAGWLNATISKIKNADYSVALKRVRLSAIAETKQNFRSGVTPLGAGWLPLKHPRPRGAIGQKPLWDRGLLMASLTGERAEGHVSAITAKDLTVGTNLEYAAIHFYGGVITAKKAKFLAIPVSRQAVTVGSPRRFPTKLEFLPTKRGGLLFESKTSKRGVKSIIVHYVLVKSVTIPARPFLGWHEKMLDKSVLILLDFTISLFKP